MHRQSTQQGIDLIKSFEGFSPTIYICPAGWETVGFGHALRKGENERFSKGITEQEALELLDKDNDEAEKAVSRLIRVFLTDSQFDSLVDFTFNLGGGALQRSTLRSCLNRGGYTDAGDQFLKWIWGGGRKLPGLYKRRVAERNLFLSGI